MALVLLAILIGVVLPVQTGVNAQLRVPLGHPLTTAFASFLVGTLVLGASMFLARVPAPPASLESVPLWQWTGGALGALYIAAAVVLAPRLGGATLIAAVVTGQMVASVVLDHYGLVGFPQQPATPARLIGAALVIAGVLLIRR